MAKNLLIVESPAKAKTINRYLGSDFEVLASYGHIRDLPSKDGAVDPDNDFSMHYELSEGSKKHVDAIVKATRKAEAVYLATDLDREGEAISWHIYEILKGKKLADKIPFTGSNFQKSQNTRFWMPWPIHANFPWISSMHNKPDARLITWLDLHFRHCCGKRSNPDYQREGFKVRPCV